jgi:hypothetical protein
LKFVNKRFIFDLAILELQLQSVKVLIDFHVNFLDVVLELDNLRVLGNVSFGLIDLLRYVGLELFVCKHSFGGFSVDDSFHQGLLTLELLADQLCL